MISLLISLLIIALYLGLIYWVVGWFIQGRPLQVVGVILVLVFLLYALQRLGFAGL